MNNIVRLSFGAVGPQHPIYGIHYTNIADRLSKRNWKTKAIVRSDSAGWLYLWIAKGTRKDKAGHKVSSYFVRVHPPEPRERRQYYQAEFKTLTDALTYINGEDDGLLARETTPASRGVVYPSEHHAPIYINYIHRPTPASSK